MIMASCANCHADEDVTDLVTRASNGEEWRLPLCQSCGDAVMTLLTPRSSATRRRLLTALFEERDPEERN